MIDKKNGLLGLSDLRIEFYFEASKLSLRQLVVFNQMIEISVVLSAIEWSQYQESFSKFLIKKYKAITHETARLQREKRDLLKSLEIERQKRTEAALEFKLKKELELPTFEIAIPRLSYADLKERPFTGITQLETDFARYYSSNSTISASDLYEWIGDSFGTDLIDVQAVEQGSWKVEICAASLLAITGCSTIPPEFTNRLLSQVQHATKATNITIKESNQAEEVKRLSFPDLAKARENSPEYHACPPARIHLEQFNEIDVEFDPRSGKCRYSLRK